MSPPHVCSFPPRSTPWRKSDVGSRATRLDGSGGGGAMGTRRVPPEERGNRESSEVPQSHMLKRCVVFPIIESVQLAQPVLPSRRSYSVAKTGLAQGTRAHCVHWIRVALRNIRRDALKAYDKLEKV
ncbi:hypothetical protein JHK85_001370 [Glycine max]|nr:hypothetical protein JHK87_001341 [Glycine soja]KAG5068993.1 hypothetical protein JHK85_001370 [Glycine max]KAG5088723.1 hypothetical protein JHK86_001335 [Glycine max]